MQVKAIVILKVQICHLLVAYLVLNLSAQSNSLLHYLQRQTESHLLSILCVFYFRIFGFLKLEFSVVLWCCLKIGDLIYKIPSGHPISNIHCVEMKAADGRNHLLYDQLDGAGCCAVYREY